MGRGRAWRLLRQSRSGKVDLGCTIDNYHGPVPLLQGDDGDLEFYVLAGPGVPDVVRRFSWLTGGQAFAPKWSSVSPAHR